MLRAGGEGSPPHSSAERAARVLFAESREVDRSRIQVDGQVVPRARQTTRKLFSGERRNGAGRRDCAHLWIPGYEPVHGNHVPSGSQDVYGWGVIVGWMRRCASLQQPAALFMDRAAALVSHAQAVLTCVTTYVDVHLSAADTALVRTIYDPPRACQPWRLRDVLPDGPTRYYSLARWALVDALRGCGVGPGDRVLVPELICREVLASINVLGATTAFYPVSPQLCAVLSPNSTTPAKAVLAVNYFGFPQRLEVFREYCQRSGAVLIEDNAHGFLSRDTNGQLLGSRGDAAVFSFRKTVALPDGAALVLNGNRELPQTDDVTPVNGLGARYRLKQACRPITRRLGPIRTLKAIDAVRQLRQPFVREARSPSAPDAETRIPMDRNPRALISRSLTIAEPEIESRRRRALYELAARIVEAAGAAPVFPNLPRNVVPYGFPMFVSPQRAPGITAHLARHGLPLTRWPDLPEAVVPFAAAHYRDLMVVPFLW